MAHQFVDKRRVMATSKMEMYFRIMLTVSKTNILQLGGTRPERQSDAIA